MAADVVVTKIDGFGYGGRRVFSGEIIPLMGLPNDGKLITLGYLARYTDSNHQRSDEVEGFGRRFISEHHYHSFLRMMADTEESVLERQRYLSQDQTELEYRAIEARGLHVRENQGPRQTSLASIDVPSSVCPIDGCGESIAGGMMREHVESHENDIKKVAEPKATTARRGRRPKVAAES